MSIKISGLAEGTTLANDDLLEVVDVSAAGGAVTGQNKKFTVEKIHTNLELAGFVKGDVVLKKDNTDAFTPTGDYNPATKKYADDVALNKAEKANVLELDNTDAFTPSADYEPATKIYVDSNSSYRSPTSYINGGVASGVEELQPDMTSNTTGNVEATVSSSLSNTTAWQGKNGIKSGGAGNDWSSAGTTGQWNFQFNDGVKKIKGMRFYNIYTSTSNGASSFNIYKEGLTTDIVVAGVTPTANTAWFETEVIFSSTVTTDQIGIDILGSVGSSIGVGEVEFIFEELIDITTVKARSSDDTTDITSIAQSITGTLTASTKYFINLDSSGTATFSTTEATGTNRSIAYLSTDSSGDIIADSITQILSEPYETRLSQGGETLWSGSAGTSTITLSQDINDYKFLEITAFYSNNNIIFILSVDSFKQTSSSSEIRIGGSDATTTRNLDISYATDTSITIGNASSMKLTKVVGIK